MLHEALPIIRGQRFAYLPFLYDEAAAAIRQANNAHLGEGVQIYQMHPSRPALFERAENAVRGKAAVRQKGARAAEEAAIHIARARVKGTVLRCCGGIGGSLKKGVIRSVIWGLRGHGAVDGLFIPGRSWRGSAPGNRRCAFPA